MIIVLLRLLSGMAAAESPVDELLPGGKQFVAFREQVPLQRVRPLHTLLLPSLHAQTCQTTDQTTAQTTNQTTYQTTNHRPKTST